MQISSRQLGTVQGALSPCTVRSGGTLLWSQTPSPAYTPSSDFTRDKFSGKKPKLPNVKLTGMTKLEAFEFTQPVVKATCWYGKSPWDISGDWPKLCASSTAKTTDLSWWYSWISQNPGSSFLNLQSRLLLEAHNKALEPDFDTPVFLAELGETLSMLRNPLKGLLKFMKKRKSFTSLLELTTNQWLQYRYGIVPLLSDLDNASKAVTRAKHRYQNVLRKSSAFGTFVGSKSVKDMGVTSNSYVIVIMRSTVTDEYTVNCSRYYNWTENVYKPLLNLNGDLATLGGVLWELIPFSFVADWFVNTGDWIASHRDNPRISHKGFTSTVVRRYTRNYSAVGVRCYSRYYPTVYPIDDGNHYRFGFVSKVRTMPAKPAWPVLNWDFGNVMHIADGLSLTFQQLIGKRS